MELKINPSFTRDAKKLPGNLLDELEIVFNRIKDVQSLGDLPYSVKKMEGSRKLKAFRLRLSEHSDFRLGFYLEDNTVILSRILNRKDIYKKFPPKK